jgi:hypothetical protein
VRRIEHQMVQFLDAKLASNGLAQQAIRDHDPRTLYICAAEACVGIREVGGNNQGPMVEMIQRTIGGADREAWCMSFVQTMLAYAELKTGVESPIWACEHCMTVLHKTPERQRVKTHPLRGAIVIWNKEGTYSGHCGIVIEANQTSFWGIEGNTEAGVNENGTVERDGGGVYFTKRDKIRAGDLVVQGFLKPF